MYPLIDTHCHLDAYTTDDEVGEVLTRARSVRVRLIVNAGTTVESSRRCVKLSKTFPELFAGVGIHPMDLTGPVDERVYSQLLDCATSTHKVIVISEIGLDFLDNMPDRATQYQAFREQIRLARDLQLPIVFHSREADEEVLRVLREERAYEVGGGDALLPGRYRYGQGGHRLGILHITGEAACSASHTSRPSATDLPLEHIVLETDSAPQPFKPKRDRWTEPRHLQDIADKLAELRGIDVDQVRRATTDNFFNMLGDRGAKVRSAVIGERNRHFPATSPGRRSIVIEIQSVKSTAGSSCRPTTHPSEPSIIAPSQSDCRISLKSDDSSDEHPYRHDPEDTSASIGVMAVRKSSSAGPKQMPSTRSTSRNVAWSR